MVITQTPALTDPVLVHATPVRATVGPVHTLAAACAVMREQRTGAVVITDPSMPTPAILSERDVVLAIASGADPTVAQTGAWMRHDMGAVDASMTIGDAARYMLRIGVRHLLVAQDGELVAIVSLRDVIGLVLGADATLPAA